MFQKDNFVSGIIQFIPLLVIAIVASILVIAKTNLNIGISLSIPSASPLVIEQSPFPSPSPTPTEEPKSQSPSPTPTLKATAAPQIVTSAPAGTGYSKITIATQRGNFTISLVSIDMNAAKMITDTASDSDCPGDCPTIALSDFVARNAGFAGIHGTYFCPADYADCAGKKNSFDFPVYNSRLGKWINAGNLFWNNRSLIYWDGGGMHFMRNANSFGGGLSAGVTNHPGLLEGGNVIADQFGLSEKQMAKGTKGGIGIRGNIVYLVVASGVDMLDFANIFKSLGASEALNLDGGGSVALWFGGYKVGPGRALPNAIIFAPR